MDHTNHGFQFHNGTINTRPIDFPVYSQVGFNSTTVQLIRNAKDETVITKLVSIPQRYN